MAIDQKRMIQAVYDAIYDALTATPAGVGAGRPIEDRRSSYLSLCMPGMAVDASQFANAWSPLNPQGGTYQSEMLAMLVDSVPVLSPQYAASGNSVDQLYGEIVRANVSPPPEDSAAKAAYQRAFDILHVDGTDYDDQGRPVTVKVKSPILRNYENKRAAYYAALLSYMSNYNNFDLSKPEDARKWSILGPALRAPLDAAFNDLQTARPGVVENAIATVGQYEASSLAGIFADARRTYELTKRESTVQPGLFWHWCDVFPGNWFADAAADNFTGMTIESRSLRINQSSRMSSWGGGGGINLGLWRVGGGASGSSQRYDMSSETSNLRVSFKLGRIEIRRRWLNPSLFTLSGWSAAGRPAGGFSNGQDQGNSGVFPLMPTSFIVARDIQISGQWGSTDSHYASQTLSASASVGWGPFSLSGRYSNTSSTRSFNSTFDGTTISVPGIQIIGWISAILPFCPPTGGPSAVPPAQPQTSRPRNPYHVPKPDTDTATAAAWSGVAASPDTGRSAAPFTPPASPQPLPDPGEPLSCFMSAES